MNTDCDTYGTLIKDYNREYLGRINKYLKTLQDAYNLLKEWNKLQHLGKENGEALVKDGAKCSKFSRWGRNNHTVEKCTARYRDDGTILHNMEEIEEVDLKYRNDYQK